MLCGLQIIVCGLGICAYGSMFANAATIQDPFIVRGNVKKCIFKVAPWLHDNH